MHTITQKKGLESRVYTIDPQNEFVEVQFNTIKDKLRYKIHLLEVGNEIQYEADNLIVGKIAMVVMGAISLASLGAYFFGDPEDSGSWLFNCVMWGAMTIIGYFKPNKDDLIIANGNKVIRLFRTKPNEEKVLEFVNNLIKIANERKRSFLINFDLNEDQFMANLHYSQSIGLIDLTEIEELKNEFQVKKLL